MRYTLYCRKKKFLGVLPELPVTDTNMDTDHRKLKVPFRGMLEYHIPAKTESRYFDVIKGYK